MKLVARLDHIAVTVSDLDRSLTFYKDVLGLEETERHLLQGDTISTMTAKPNVVMQVVRLKTPHGPEILLDLQQYIQPMGVKSNAALGMANHSHFCFTVEDMDITYRELTQKGVEFVSAPVTFKLNQNGAEGALRVVFLLDPDGFVLELLEVKTTETPRAHGVLPTA